MSPNKLGLGAGHARRGVPRAVAGFWSCSGHLTLGNEFLHVEPAVSHVSVTTFSGVPAFCSSRILSSKVTNLEDEDLPALALEWLADHLNGSSPVGDLSDLPRVASEVACQTFRSRVRCEGVAAEFPRKTRHRDATLNPRHVPASIIPQPRLSDNSYIPIQRRADGGPAGQ